MNVPIEVALGCVALFATISIALLGALWHLAGRISALETKMDLLLAGQVNIGRIGRLT